MFWLYFYTLDFHALEFHFQALQKFRSLWILCLVIDQFFPSYFFLEQTTFLCLFVKIGLYAQNMLLICAKDDPTKHSSFFLATFFSTKVENRNFFGLRKQILRRILFKTCTNHFCCRLFFSKEVEIEISLQKNSN